eukprot:1148322-Prorocentrum_minimum.AAC.2
MVILMLGMGLIAMAMQVSSAPPRPPYRLPKPAVFHPRGAEPAREARVYSHDAPIRHRKRGYILTTARRSGGRLGGDSAGTLRGLCAKRSRDRRLVACNGLYRSCGTAGSRSGLMSHCVWNA